MSIFSSNVVSPSILAKLFENEFRAALKKEFEESSKDLYAPTYDSFRSEQEKRLT